MNRDNKGRFSKSKKVVKIAFFLATIVSIVIIYTHLFPVEVKVPVEVTVDNSEAMFDKKIDSLEKALVENLRKCESAGFNEDYGLVTYDPKQGGANNDKAMSYGTLQFKKATVIYYYKSLYKQEITGKQAILIALDDEKAGKLAQDIIFTSKNLADDWLNCSNRLSLESQIKAIKAIK